MLDFDYDAMCKKRVARSASRRKCGSKNKKCTLPSDYLTQSQWKKRNGEVFVFSLKQPMKWAEFKKLSPTSKREYIGSLSAAYNAGGAAIARMLGVSYATLTSHCAEIGISFSGNRGKRMTKAEREVWDAFCENEPEDTAPPVAEEESSPAGFDTKAADEPVAPQPPSAEDSCGMMSFSVAFRGDIDPDSIANSLRRILPEGKRSGVVEITCHFCANS
jgi:hypothetical protein